MSGKASRKENGTKQKPDGNWSNPGLVCTLIENAEILRHAEGLSPKQVLDLAKQWENGAMILRLHAANQQGFSVPPMATSCVAHFHQAN